MTTVFVYGTLKRGFSNYRRLMQAASFLGEATSVSPNYAMLDGGFPKVLDCPERGHPILGELFEVDAATLADLDRLEGHPRWYQRKRRLFRKTDGTKVEAWVYIMQSGRMESWEYAHFVQPVRGTLAWHYQETPEDR